MESSLKLDKDTVIRMAPIIVSLINSEADSRELSAGYNGMMGDNGASYLKGLAQVWQAGINRRIPSQLIEYADKAYAQLEHQEMMKDPEYKEYQRLKSKFSK